MEKKTLVPYEDRKKELYRASIAKETRRALLKQWNLYSLWCQRHGLADFPTSLAVAEAYFIELLDQKKKLASIEQAKWALDSWHKMNGLPSITDSKEIKTLLKGIKRTVRAKQIQKEALSFDRIQQAPFADDLKGLRDKLLLVLGACGGFRRSELVQLRFEDISPLQDGIRVEIQTSKTNQEGKSEYVDLAKAKDPDFCPYLLLEKWKIAAQIEQGYIFRSFYRGGKLSPRRLSDHQVAVLVKQYGKSLGLDSKNLSGHSLRAGLATFLLEKAVPLNLVSKQLRHKRADTTLRYDRSQTLKTLRGLF